MTLETKIIISTDLDTVSVFNQLVLITESELPSLPPPAAEVITPESELLVNSKKFNTQISVVIKHELTEDLPSLFLMTAKTPYILVTLQTGDTWIIAPSTRHKQIVKELYQWLNTIELEKRNRWAFNGYEQKWIFNKLPYRREPLSFIESESFIMHHDINS